MLTSAHDRRLDVQVLRGLAIALVCLHHAFPQVFPGGFVGVDVFFVLSGFLIGTLWVRGERTGSWSWKRFVSRRLLRLVPALLLMLMVVVPLSVVLLPSWVFSDVAITASVSVLWVVNWFFVFSGSEYFDQPFSPLLHLWSLSLEVQFYIVTGGVLCLFPFLSAFWRLAILWCLSLLSFALALTLVGTNLLYFSLPTRFWQFGAGLILAFCVKALPLPPSGRWWRLLLWVCVVSTLWFWSVFFVKIWSHPGTLALLPVLGVCCLLWLGSRSGEDQIWLTGRWVSVLASLGTVSYGLYLWHWPVLEAFRLWLSVPLAPWLSFMALFLSWVLAAVSHRWVEFPLLNSRRPGLAAVFVSLSGVVFLVMVVLSVLPGTRPDRFSILGDTQALPHVRTALTCDLIGVTPELLDRHRFCALEGGSPDADTRIWVWGDSHASRLAMGFHGMEGVSSVFQRSVSGCVPAFGVDRIQGFRRFSCDVAHRRILEDIRVHGDPSRDVLVVHARWSMPGFLVSLDVPVQGFSFDDPVFVAAQERFWDEIRALGMRVVVVGPTPDHHALPIPLLLWGQEVWNRSLEDHEVSASVHQDRHRFVVDALHRRTRGFAGWVDPVDVFCGDGVCRVSHDGRPLFTDRDHLSLWGARLMAERIRLSWEESFP